MTSSGSVLEFNTLKFKVIHMSVIWLFVRGHCTEYTYIHYANMHPLTYIYAHLHTHAYTHIHNIYTHLHKHTPTPTPMHTYTHTHIHTKTYAHLHT